MREVQDKERTDSMTNEALIEIRSRMDPGDRWGSVMGERFGIATALYIEGEEIPTEWEFSPGLISESSIRADDLWPDIYWLETLRSGEYSVEDLILAGNVLRRYSQALERAGLSY